MKYYYKRKVRCSVCGRIDEGYQLVIYLNWFSIIYWFKINRWLCERCISNMFKGFKKELELEQLGLTD